MDQINELLNLSIWIAAYYISFYFHEGGHYIATRISGIKVLNIKYTRRLIIPVPVAVELDDSSIEGSKLEIYTKVVLMMLSGPIIGFIPIILIWVLVHDDLFNVVIVSLVYIAGCRRDLFEFMSLILGRPVEGMEITE